MYSKSEHLCACFVVLGLKRLLGTHNNQETKSSTKDKKRKKSKRSRRNSLVSIEWFYIVTDSSPVVYLISYLNINETERRLGTSQIVVRYSQVPWILNQFWLTSCCIHHQSGVKSKPIVTWVRDFSRACRGWQDFIVSYDWFFVDGRVVIGQMWLPPVWGFRFEFGYQLACTAALGKNNFHPLTPKKISAFITSKNFRHSPISLRSFSSFLFTSRTDWTGKCELAVMSNSCGRSRYECLRFVVVVWLSVLFICCVMLNLV